MSTFEVVSLDVVPAPLQRLDLDPRRNETPRPATHPQRTRYARRQLDQIPRPIAVERQHGAVETKRPFTGGAFDDRMLRERVLDRGIDARFGRDEPERGARLGARRVDAALPLSD